MNADTHFAPDGHRLQEDTPGRSGAVACPGCAFYRLCRPLELGGVRRVRGVVRSLRALPAGAALSRTLQAMQRQGLIAVRARLVRLVGPDGLQRLAQLHAPQVQPAR